jgi:hypothetical protein
MPSDFRKEIDENWAIFRRENAGQAVAMTMHIIPRSELLGYVVRGSSGDKEARAVVSSLSRWTGFVREAKGFACISCRGDLTLEEACGFVLLAPHEPGRQIGMAGAFCARCHAAGPDVIEANVHRGIEQQGIGVPMRPQ